MRRVLAVLFAIGVVVGSWRVLGDGADITDPAWVTNATKNVGELFGWSDEAVRERTKNSPDSPSPSSTKDR